MSALGLIAGLSLVGTPAGAESTVELQDVGTYCENVAALSLDIYQVRNDQTRGRTNDQYMAAAHDSLKPLVERAIYLAYTVEPGALHEVALANFKRCVEEYILNGQAEVE